MLLKVNQWPIRFLKHLSYTWCSWTGTVTVAATFDSCRLDPPKNVPGQLTSPEYKPCIFAVTSRGTHLRAFTRTTDVEDINRLWNPHDLEFCVKSAAASRACVIFFESWLGSWAFAHGDSQVGTIEWNASRRRWSRSNCTGQMVFVLAPQNKTSTDQKMIWVYKC